MTLTPRLLSPKIDVVFKYVFASEPALLMALINTILPADGYAAARALEVRNPDINRNSLTEKQIVLDINAVDASGRQFNVEMQVQSQTIYPTRAIYYLARLHGGQIGEGQPYEAIDATLGIHFLDFVLDTETPAWRHCFEWRERDRPAWRLSDSQALWMIELPKAQLVLDKAEQSGEGFPLAGLSKLGWWAHFFNHPEAIMTAETAAPDTVREAAEKLARISTDRQVRQFAEERERALVYWAMEEKALLAKGRAEGEAIGIAKGEAIGEVKGVAKGKLIAKRVFAQALLANNVSIEKTASLTGLSREEVEQLKQDENGCD